MKRFLGNCVALVMEISVSGVGRVEASSITGFDNGAEWTVNSSVITSSAFNGNTLTLTDSEAWEARSAWFDTPQSVSAFTVSFTYTANQLGGTAPADGIAFAFQNAASGLNALGEYGGYLGYASIKPSVAV
jgi:hypothetical protein